MFQDANHQAMRLLETSVESNESCKADECESY